MLSLVNVISRLMWTNLGGSEALVLAHLVIENSSVRGSGEINQLLARTDTVIKASFKKMTFQIYRPIFFTKDGNMMMI
jgi:hypothetical protein